MAEITQIPNIEKDAMQAANEQLKRIMPVLIERAELVSKIRHAHFVAHTKAGFTEAQALQLCTNIFG